MSTILTLQMDGESQARFDALRQAHYPAALNKIAAHLTLFHNLSESDAVRAELVQAASRRGFSMRVSEVMSLGRGVALRVESGELLALHRGLAGVFAESLSAQDRQAFRPHVVVQNKVSGEQARALLYAMRRGFAPCDVAAVGLERWEYLGGPWELRERLRL